MYEKQLAMATALINTTTEEETENFFEELSNSDLWTDIHLSNIKLEYSSEKENVFITADSLAETPVSPLALTSIKERALNNSEILNKMNPEDIVAMLNMSWSYMVGKKGKTLTRAGSVMAIHSERYVPIQQKDLFSTIKDYLYEEFPKTKFMNMAFSHEKTSVKFEIADIKDPLMSPYYSMAKAAGTIPESLLQHTTMCATMLMGDLGQSAVHVYPTLKVGNKEYIIGKPLSLPHRDDTTLKEIVDSYPKIYSLISSSVDSLVELLKIKIKYPYNCAVNIIKKYKLPKRAAAETLIFLEGLEFEETTAYDIYFTLAEMLQTAKFKDLCSLRQLQIQESFARLSVEKNWDKYDTSKPVEL